MTSQGAARVDWADIAKAFSIVGVVLLHVTGEFGRELCLPRDGDCSPWAAVNRALTPLRVPLFFAVSGFFAAAAIRRPWRQVLGPRILNQLYVYLLWTALALTLLALVGAEPWHRLGAGMGRAWLGYGDYWYVFALAVFFPLVKLTRRVPAPVVVAVAAVLALLPWWWQHRLGEPVDKRVWRLMFYLIYFVIGARLAGPLARVAETGRRLSVCLLAVAVLTALEVAYLSTAGPNSWSGPWPWLVLSATAVFAGAALAQQAARWSAARWFGRVVGRRTLGLYLMQGLLVGALVPVLLEDVDGPGPGWLRWGFVPAVTLGVVVTSLLIETGLRSLRLGWLFRLPGIDRRRGPAGSEPPGPGTSGSRSTGSMPPGPGSTGRPPESRPPVSQPALP